MEYNRMAKEIVNFQRHSFENWYNAVSMLQDQTTSTMDMMLDQAGWMPEESRQPIHDWMNVFHRERDRFKSYVNEGFDGLEKFVSEGIEEARKTAGRLAKQTESQMQAAEKQMGKEAEKQGEKQQ